ncbi:2,3-diketo-L-gulonate-binding periplasmic protein YiaO [Klebsiella spallanzanii]|uniref:2,3-diketo-L-gulonate-binding periplasmic protein YiaO n=1 Tax=Klebsiella spallanzanii TaxID=2587528 RepID=A0ABY6V5F5_9ENTR|nr:DctP family TRAP transporter solute-binding subunit [Klebsiella spallanzanii]VUS22008.1 2,3-diketo-L-gulonate-binding periplasmic protein YiaO [Klebsiella spallanzanii]
MVFSTAERSEKRRFSIGFEGSMASSQGVGIQEMVRVAGQLSQGEMAFELYPDAKLGNGPKMVDMAQQGELDIFLGGAGYFAALDGRINVFDIPYLFENVEQAYRIMDSDFGREMLDVLDQKKLKGLSFWENGIRSFTNNVKPVTHPDDFSGLKIRTMPGNQVHEALWQSVDIDTLPLPSGAIYAAIQEDTINSQEHPISVIYARKLFEVQRYLSLTRHMYGPLIQVMNSVTFTSLSKPQQDILLSASYAGAVATRNFSNENEAIFLAQMKRAGLQVNDVDPKPFREMMKPAIEHEFIDKNGDDWLKKINAMLADDGK